MRVFVGSREAGAYLRLDADGHEQERARADARQDVAREQRADFAGRASAGAAAHVGAAVVHADFRDALGVVEAEVAVLELVAVADLRGDVARNVGAHYGVDAYDDYHALLDRDDIDLVDICTPEFLHAEQTLAAAAAGKHVHCEKPMAASVEECDAMIAACASVGVRLMIGHSRRFTPRYRQIRRAIDAGDIGTPRFLRENERRPSAFPSAPPDPVKLWAPRTGETKPWILSNPIYVQ